MRENPLHPHREDPPCSASSGYRTLGTERWTVLAKDDRCLIEQRDAKVWFAFSGDRSTRQMPSHTSAASMLVNVIDVEPTAMEQTVLDVAAEVITKSGGVDQLQLHKLLYLVQAAHLAWFGTPAYEERIEAWIHGPVTRRVAGTYMQYGFQTITHPTSGNGAYLDERAAWTVGKVLEDYGRLSGHELAQLLKEEGMPWTRVREGIPDDVSSDAEIPVDLILKYHKAHGLPLTSEPTEEENEIAQRFFDGDESALGELVKLVTDDISESA